MDNTETNNHYVDNKKLYNSIVEYKAHCNLAARKKQEKPQIPNYIGECIMKIAEGLSHRPNFINYSFRDEMIADGIENCVSYFDNFDPSKSNNPFAYFTQIIYYAFLRRILKEKKHMYIKHKAMEESLLFDELMQQATEENSFSAVNFDIDPQSVEFIKNFEDLLKEKKDKKKKKKGLEKFME
jgi:hypothetical protein